MGGSLDFSEITDAANGRVINTFVETGTYYGESAFNAAKHFSEVYTIEIDYKLFTSSKCRAMKENVHNISFIHGDSYKMLHNVVPRVAEGAVYFIDAHISGSDSGWNKVTSVPLLNDLDSILQYKIGPSLFIFNDVRFWAGHPEEAWDWKHISTSKVLEAIEDAGVTIESNYEKNDRFFVLTS
jgi:hypothetical protein